MHIYILTGILVFLVILVTFTAIVSMRNTSQKSTGPLDPKPLPTDLVTPLTTGLYTQSNKNRQGFMIEILTGNQYTIANVYGVETDCGKGDFLQINKYSYLLAPRLLYSGSAIIDNKIIHTYASVEKSSYIGSLNSFNCNTKDPANYKREVYNTLYITELGSPEKIMITFTRQKTKNEYPYTDALATAGSAWKVFSQPHPSNGNKQQPILDTKNFFDTNMNYKIENIILNKINNTGIPDK